MKIKFHPNDFETEVAMEAPKPAARYLPTWFRKMSKFTAGTEQKPTLAKGGKSNLTLKNCPPFLDAMMFGYMVTLPCDIQVVKVAPQQYKMTWSADLQLIDSHPPAQTPGYPSESGTPLSAFKWLFPWGIETPPGYSVLVTHPQNRYDLPFRTFSGVVDTDTYNVPVNFPFEMVDHMVSLDSFILKEGTPIAQIIPFKRDSWKAKTEKFSEAATIKKYFDLNKIIFRSYKLNYWKKKSFL